MSTVRLILITTLAMLAFAANSILCRLALVTTPIDAASFTSIRLASGAMVLLIIVSLRYGVSLQQGNWRSALALFAYAAGFSFAYLSLSAATGALLLFGSVQATMIGYGLARGERPSTAQLSGILMALVGLIYLLLPGAAAPPFSGAALMLAAGFAWGVYSLLGRGSSNPLRDTAGNFIRTVPLALVLSMLFIDASRVDVAGAAYAVASGAIASGLGYALWYAALPRLRATTAATVQLSVPAIAAIGGVVLLGEPLTMHLVIASLLILGGVAIYVWRRMPSPA
jgi:drug/metabolite transporter (DMT)-like permease